MNHRRLEIKELQECIKMLMASRRLKLADLAKDLKISIATAKRLLNVEDLSLTRVLQICDWLDVSFHEIVEISRKHKTKYFFCSPEQERFLATFPAHFAFLRAIQKGETLLEIKSRHCVTDLDCQSYLADLEAQGFLVLENDSKFKLLLPDGMSWRPDGPLWERFFGTWIKEMSGHISYKNMTDDENTIVDISQRKMSKHAFQEMKREIDALSRKYASISRLERKIHGTLENNKSENGKIENSSELDFYSCMIVADRWTAPIWNVKPYGK